MTIAQAICRPRQNPGDIAAIVPQFVVFETTYVLQSQYAIMGESLASVIRDIVTTPGVQTIDTCPVGQGLPLTLTASPPSSILFATSCKAFVLRHER